MFCDGAGCAGCDGSGRMHPDHVFTLMEYLCDGDHYIRFATRLIAEGRLSPRHRRMATVILGIAADRVIGWWTRDDPALSAVVDAVAAAPAAPWPPVPGLWSPSHSPAR